jgi:hypothetical protein
MNKSAATTLVEWGHWIVQVLAAKFANLALLPNQLEATWEKKLFYAKIPAFTTVYKFIIVSTFKKIFGTVFSSSNSTC